MIVHVKCHNCYNIILTLGCSCTNLKLTTQKLNFDIIHIYYRPTLFVKVDGNVVNILRKKSAFRYDNGLKLNIGKITFPIFIMIVCLMSDTLGSVYDCSVKCYNCYNIISISCATNAWLLTRQLFNCSMSSYFTTFNVCYITCSLFSR